MNKKHIQKLLEMEDEEELLQILKKDPALKKNWDEFISQDEQEMEKFVDRVQTVPISDQEYKLYIEGKANADLIEKIESDIEYQNLVKNFENETSLTENDNKCIEEVLENIKRTEGSSIANLIKMYKNCFKQMAGHNNEPNPKKLQILYKKSPFYFCIPEKDYLYKLRIYFNNNKPATFQIDIRSDNKTVIDNLKSVGFSGKTWFSQNGICKIEMNEIVNLEELELLIVIENKETKICFKDLL